MTTPAVSSTAVLLGMTSMESAAPVTRAYLTKTSFVAVHFDEAGKGRIVFLPEGVMLCVVGPSPFLPEGFEVKAGRRIYHVFEMDLMARSSLIFEPIRAKRRAMVARA
jgi:hypothetical protein